MLYKLGHFCARRRFTVLGAWLVLIALIVTLVSVFGAKTTNNLILPGTDSQAATDMLAEQFPPQQNGTNPIVFHAPTGSVNDPASRAAIEASYQKFSLFPTSSAPPIRSRNRPQD